MHETTLIAFVAVTSVAVVLQTLILAGMYVSTRKMGQRMEALSRRVEEQVLPLVEKVRGLVDESAPKIQTVVTNLVETSELVRTQAGQIDEAVTEIVGIARAQAERADVLATRTMQRVDLTAEKLQRTVNAPVRHLSALVDGVTAGLSALVSGRKAHSTKAASSDEMFI
jgi:methyl-accepting chemotaxis protein